MPTTSRNSRSTSTRSGGRVHRGRGFDAGKRFFGRAIFGSGALLDDLVSYVRGGKGCRLILVGDDAQLPPIGVDYSPALDPKALSVYGEVVYTSLDEVVRQEAESGILFNATLVRCMLENGICEVPRFRMDFLISRW